MRSFTENARRMSRDMRFPTMWYVRPAKPQISLRILHCTLVYKKKIALYPQGYLAQVVRKATIGPRREKTCLRGCEQQRRRPACAYAQSDQCLCNSLTWKHHLKTCYEQIFNILHCLCSWVGWFESQFVRNPEDRFSRDEAQLIFTIVVSIQSMQ